MLLAQPRGDRVDDVAPVEWLTDRIEQDAAAYIERIDALIALGVFIYKRIKARTVRTKPSSGAIPLRSRRSMATPVTSPPARR